VQVLVEQVLELEAPDERIALDAAVGEVAAGDARALAVGDPADAPAHERARVQTVGQHLGHVVEGRKPLPSGVTVGSTRTPTIPRTLVRHCQQRSVSAASRARITGSPASSDGALRERRGETPEPSRRVNRRRGVPGVSPWDDIRPP
jgi:hypothetical protein